MPYAELDGFALAINRRAHDRAVIRVGVRAVIVGRIRPAISIGRSVNPSVHHFNVKRCRDAGRIHSALKADEVHPAGRQAAGLVLSNGLQVDPV